MDEENGVDLVQYVGANVVFGGGVEVRMGEGRDGKGNGIWVQSVVLKMEVQAKPNLAYAPFPSRGEMGALS